MRTHPVTALPLLVLLIAAAALCGCSRSVGQAHAQQDPAALARALVAAVQAGDDAAFQELLTVKARQGVQSGSGFDIGEGRFGNARIGEASVTGDTAEVPLAVEQEGDTQDLTLLLRKEAGEWRMYGMRVAAGGEDMTIDLEQLAEMMSALATQMSEGMARAFEDAQRQHAEREITRRRQGFEALHAMSRGEIERSWRNEDDFRGRSTRAALENVARRLGLDIAEGEHVEALARAVDRDVRQLPRIVAIELLCQDVGLEPVYPPVDMFAGELGVEGAEARRDALSFVAASGRAASHAGPFRVWVEHVDEYPPYGRGAVRVVVQGLGMDPGLLALLDALGEKVIFRSIIDANGNSLRVNDNTRYIGGGSHMSDRYSDTTRIELKNLLRGVEQIATIEGVQRLVLPLEVVEVKFDHLEKGARQKVGSLTFTVRDTGPVLTIDIEGPEEAVRELQILGLALDASENDIQVHYEDVTPWRPGQCRYQLQAETAPRELYMKVVTRRQVIEYPFRLASIPLLLSAEMPAHLAPVTFGGHPAPVSVHFREFRRPANQLPIAQIDVHNHANKDIEHVSVQFYYLDARGKDLENSIHTVSAPMTPGNLPPLVRAGARVRNEATAFFMPDAARNLRIEVEAVGFMDGTTWSATP